MANYEKPTDEDTKHLIASMLTVAVFVADVGSGRHKLVGYDTKDARENALLTYRNLLQELDEETG